MNERSFIFRSHVPTPARAYSRSTDPNPRRRPGLLCQTRLSPGQYARHQCRSGHQRRPDLSLFRQQRSRDLGHGRPTQKGDPGGAGTRPAGSYLARITGNFVHRALLRKFAERAFGLRVDLYAEASRNPQVANLVRDVLQTSMDGVTDLIARSPEGKNAAGGLTPDELSELIFAVARGMLMRDVLQPQEMTAAERRTAQLEVVRRLWRLLFTNTMELAGV